MPPPHDPGREEIVALLGMERHPVAGWMAAHYDDGEVGGRSNLSSMYYLLAGDEPLPLHKTFGVEIWHFHLGAPAEIAVVDGAGQGYVARLGSDLAAGERPQLAVPAYRRQSCRSLGAWTLFGRTMSPGFSPRGAIVLSADA